MESKNTKNSLVHNGNLTIMRKADYIPEKLEYITGNLIIQRTIDFIPQNLKVGGRLGIKASCPNLDLRNINVKENISFIYDCVHKIYPSVIAGDYYIEYIPPICFGFNSVYEIYESFPHLVPDEFQNEYGFEHITIKDGMRIAPIVLGSIDSNVARKCMNAKYIVVYSAEKQVLEIMRGDDYSNELYSEIFDVLPDLEYW